MNLDPRKVNWQEGSVPDLKDCHPDTILLFSGDSSFGPYFGWITPSFNEMNEIPRWGDDSYHPRWGYENPKGFWAWFRRGEKLWPEYVKFN